MSGETQAFRRLEPERCAPRRARTTKVTVSVPSDVLQAAMEQVHQGRARSLSAYVSRALAAQVGADEGQNAYLAFLDQLDQEMGPPNKEDFQWARRFASGESGGSSSR